MKIVFMGTPDFAVPCLEGLIEAGHEVVLVVTQADKPKGRGHKLTPPPVKECALSHNLQIFQPDSMKNQESYDTLKNAGADIFIVVAYGKILPESILNIPKYGCVNVHASLLPKLRGAAPIQWSIINGETVTGVTIMQMDAGLDTGDMLLKEEIPIEETDTAASLFDKLSIVGRDLLIKTLSAIKEGSVTPQKQDDTLSTYAPMIHKSMAELDFTKTGKELCFLIRGLYSYPCAQTKYEGKLLKVMEATYEKACTFTGEPGELLAVKDGAMVVKCQDGAIRINTIQMEGKKKMSVSEYVKGNNFTIGTILG